MNWKILLFFAFFIAMFFIIIFMFVSLGKQGEKHRKMIIEKVSARTFALTVAYLLLCVIESTFKVISVNDSSSQGLNPFVTLAFIAIIYVLEFFYCKTKYSEKQKNDKGGKT